MAHILLISVLLFPFVCAIEINPFHVNEPLFMALLGENNDAFSEVGFFVGVIGAAKVLADEGEKAAPIIAPRLVFLSVLSISLLP